MPDLNTLLEEWSVHAPGQWENDTASMEWYAVSNNSGIVAYFAHESTALAFRLMAINMILNGADLVFDTVPIEVKS